MQSFSLFTIFLLSCFLVGFFRHYAIQNNLIDYPNTRSSHQNPTPRGGGIVFVLLWSCFFIVGSLLNQFPLQYLKIFLPGSLLIALIGYLDDHLNLPIAIRLSIHVAAATTGVLTLGGMPELHIGYVTFQLGGWGTVLAILATTWSINLFNFMDGLDGLATVEAIFLFTAGGFLFWLSQGTSLAILAWALVAALAGFLVWNWPRAKIFMGDVGSTFLGFLIPLFAIAGEKWYGVPALLWLMLYSVFIVDASLTLLRRILAKQQWFRAHRLHAFQRLHQSGWSVKKIILAVLFINCFICLSVFLGHYYPDYLKWFLLLDILMIGFIYYWVEKRSPMFK